MCVSWCVLVYVSVYVYVCLGGHNQTRNLSRIEGEQTCWIFSVQILTFFKVNTHYHKSHAN